MGFWFFSGGLVLWGFAFLYLRSYIKRRTAAAYILGEYSSEVNRLIAEIDAAADRDLTLLEDKISALRKLLDEADKRIRLQKNELEKQNAQEAAFAALGRRYVAKAETAPSLEPAPEAAAKPQAEKAPDAEATPPRALFIRSSLQIKPKDPPFAEQVLDLYRNGFSADLIAAKLGSTVAEVELVINLSAQQAP
jgi:hypothetical protein